MSRRSDWTPSLWVDTFEELLDDELDYGDSWILNFNYNQTEKVTKEERKRGWKVYSPCAFGNFWCRNCRNTWPSARVVVLFRYRLQGHRGTVIMRPFGQACRRCDDGDFELPGFSPKVIEDTLLRLCSKIRKNCYNEDEDVPPPSTVQRRTKPHESELCEGCQAGICCQDD